VNAQSTFEAALALPELDRARLVELLLDSLGPEEDPISEEEFAAELHRRTAQIDTGAADLVPRSKLKTERR